MTTYNVAITPLDPLKFGDNRSAGLGMELDQDPSPLTVHGCLGQHLLSCNGGTFPHRLLGPLARDILEFDQEHGEEETSAELLGFCVTDASGQRWFPRPHHLRCERRTNHTALTPVELLAPEGELTGAWSGGLRAREDIEEHKDALVREDKLTEILCHQRGSRSASDAILPYSEFFGKDYRAGIAVDNRTGTVREGALFIRPYRRFRVASHATHEAQLGAGFSAWLRTLEPIGEQLDVNKRIGFLGGDRRRVTFDFGEGDDGPRPLQKTCEHIADAASTSEGFLVYLLTPAHFTGDWQHFGISIKGRVFHPVAAAVTHLDRSSGWNRSRGAPRKLATLIPAGSVFFFTWPKNIEREALFRSLWFASIDPAGRRAGFGRVLAGVWK